MTSYAATLEPPEAAPGRAERVLRVRAATFPRRLFAAVVDLGLVVGFVAAVIAGAALALHTPLPTWRELGPDLLVAGLLDRNPMAVGAAGLFLGIGALYQIYLGGILGQTLGKRLFRLRVISSRGAPPGPALATARCVALMFSLLPAGLGFLWCLFDRERRGAHDHLVGTYVILDDAG